MSSKLYSSFIALEINIHRKPLITLYLSLFTAKQVIISIHQYKTCKSEIKSLPLKVFPYDIFSSCIDIVVCDKPPRSVYQGT